MTYRYTAILSNELPGYGFSRRIEIPSIADARDGFWINVASEFTRGDDAAVWIPPAQIMYVKKLKVEGDE